MEFRREAERYCSLIERAAMFEQVEFAAQPAASLAALLSAAAQLPDGRSARPAGGPKAGKHSDAPQARREAVRGKVERAGIEPASP